MALPVIANVFRVTLNFSSGFGPATHNVLHVSAPTRNESDVALQLDEAAVAALWLPLSSAYTLASWTVLALDGSSAGITLGASAGNNGGGGPEPSPATAAIMTLRTALRGPANRGRIFMGPVGESAMDGGHADFDRDAWVGGWGTFAGTLAALDPPIHFGVASYKHATFTELTDFFAQPILGTQRKRQSRLRG